MPLFTAQATTSTSITPTLTPTTSGTREDTAGHPIQTVDSNRHQSVLGKILRTQQVSWSNSIATQTNHRKKRVSMLSENFKPLFKFSSFNLLRGVLGFWGFGVLGFRKHLLSITHDFERTYLISLRRSPIDLRWGVHLRHQNFIL